MKAFSLTDVGKIREMNQDYVFATGEVVGTLPNLLIVADGMGGHAAGDYASKYTVDRIVQLIRESDEIDPQFLMRDAISQANYELYQIAEEHAELRGMGTTLVIATVIGSILYVANIGDSRLYVAGKTMRQVTQDHSYVQEMVQRGELRACDARLHPQKNIITRAIGALSGVEIDFFRTRLYPQDKILMCTDGLTNMLDDQEIFEMIQTSESMEACTETLVSAANAAGGKDNISVVLAEPFA